MSEATMSLNRLLEVNQYAEKLRDLRKQRTALRNLPDAIENKCTATLTLNAKERHGGEQVFNVDLEIGWSDALKMVINTLDTLELLIIDHERIIREFGVDLSE